MYKCGNWMCENCIIQTFILLILLLIISALFTYKLQIFKCWYLTSLLLPFFLRFHFMWGNLGKISSVLQILTPSPFDTSQTSVFSWCFLLPDGNIFFIERLPILFPLIVMIVSFNLFYFYTLTLSETASVLRPISGNYQSIFILS